MSSLTGPRATSRWRKHRSRGGDYRARIHCLEHEIDLAAMRRFLEDGKPAGDQVTIEAITAGECPACRPAYVAADDGDDGSPEGSSRAAGQPRAPTTLAKGGHYVYCECCRTEWELADAGWEASVGGGLQITGERRPIPAGKTIDSSWFLVDPVNAVEGPEQALRRGFVEFDVSGGHPAEDDLVEDVIEAILAASRGEADERAELARIKGEHHLDDAVADGWQFVALTGLSVIRGLKRDAGTRVRAVLQGPGVTVSRERFEELVSTALDSIPSELACLIENVAVVVEDEAVTRDLFGLYEGVPLTSRGRYSGVAPDRITIYQNTISRYCRTEGEIVAEVRQTVIHEVGHHFGIDDRRLRQLGW